MICCSSGASFRLKYMERIEGGVKQEATKRELAVARKAQDRLNRQRAKWLLRRTKDLIADQLPRKNLCERVIETKLMLLECAVFDIYEGCFVKMNSNVSFAKT